MGVGVPAPREPGSGGPPEGCGPTWINRGDQYWPLDIAGVEKRRDATYIGDFCLRSRAGEWTDHPCAVFWNENPPDPNYSQYFGLHVRWDEVFIVGAGSAAEGHWNGVVAEDGEVIYSRFRHDFRTSRDGSISVDGGRDYFKLAGGPGRGSLAAAKRVRVTLVRDKLVVNDTLILPTEPPALHAPGA